MSHEARISIEGAISEGHHLDREGHAVRVTLIQGGTSKNGYTYSEEVLQALAPLVEGVHAYADHAGSDTPTRSVRDIVGFYHDAHYIPPDTTHIRGRVDATLHLFEAATWLWSLVQEACTLGKPELIGLSVDILGSWQLNEASKAREVTRILALNSCDIVTRPSAGGAFRRILHSDDLSEANSLPFDDAKRRGDSLVSDGLPKSDESRVGHRNKETLHSSTLEGELFPMDTPLQDSQGTIQEVQVTTPVTETLSVAEQQMQALMQDLQRERSQLTLERRLLESVLPEPVCAHIRARYEGRIVEAEEIDAEIQAQQNILSTLAAQGLIRGNGYEKPAVGSVVTEAEKVQAAFDRMFELDIDSTRLGNVRAFSSIREAYARVTGDASVGGFNDHSQLGLIRVSEAAPVGRITEADTTTASFSYLLGTSMNKRLLKDYQAWPAEWQRFCTIAPIRDFKQQSRVRFGAFGSLPVVAEDTAYSTVSLTDSAATYVPQKRGNLVTISREVIINDDLMAVKQIPTKLAVAAAYTLAEFVYTFLSSNPNIYDGSALFTTGAPHSNLGAANLSTAAMQSGVTAMREQTNYAGKRIGLRPRFLVVPPELEWQSMVVTKSAGVPGSNNNDINPMLGYVTPIISPQLTSSTQWFLVGDPREIDTIEIGFVGGQVNPALFIQDSPLLGANFNSDAVTFKVRHEYGGCPVDYRGLYRGI